MSSKRAPNITDEERQCIIEDMRAHPRCPCCGVKRSDTDEKIGDDGWRCSCCGAWANPKAVGWHNDSSSRHTAYDEKLLWEERHTVPWDLIIPVEEETAADD